MVLALAAASTAVLFALLPGWAERLHERPATGPGTTTAGTTAGTGPEQQRRRDVEQRLRAQGLLAEAEGRRDLLSERRPELWAETEHAFALDLLDEGGRLLEEGRMPRAMETLEAALDRLGELEARSAEVLDATLAEARRAIDAVEPEAAERSVALALQIEPLSSEARVLGERASRLPELARLLARAVAAEREERWSVAEQVHREALGVDGDTRLAREGLRRVSSRLAELAERRALVAASTALDRGELESAQTALEGLRASGSRARELAELEARLAALQTDRRVGERLAEALALESLERWVEAEAAHAAALELSPHLKAALEGRARSRARVEWDRRLDALLAQPERLSAAGVREEARALLAELGSLGPAGPQLERRLRRLDEAVSAAETTVLVTFESDGLTEVSVQRVGALGSFKSRQLELRPGSYVAVGRRAGHRDVRRELVVQAGAAPPSLRIACDERI